MMNVHQLHQVAHAVDRTVSDANPSNETRNKGFRAESAESRCRENKADENTLFAGLHIEPVVLNEDEKAT